MVNNQKCDICAFQVKCAARAKLKPFTEEAKINLGVDLTFESCDNFTPIEDEE